MNRFKYSGPISMVLSFSLMSGLFQNCAQGTKDMAEPSPVVFNESKTVAEEPLMATQSFTNISRYLNRHSGAVPYYVFVNLKLNTVAYQHPQQNRYFTYCHIDPTRRQLLETLMKTSKVCRYTQVDNPGFAHCQAIATRDLVISTSEGKIQELAKPLCGQGEDLCGIASDALRDILDDLAVNKPQGC